MDLIQKCLGNDFSYENIVEIIFTIKMHWKCSGYDSTLHLLVGFLFWITGKCGVLLDCHYSQVYSDLK